MTRSQLISWINEHDLGTGGPVVREDRGETLVVASSYSEKDHSVIVEEEIPATLSAARLWLGY